MNDESKRWAVEKNFDGINVTVYRNGDKLEIHSKNYGEMKNNLPEIVESLLLMTQKDFVVNAKLNDNKLYVYDVELLEDDVTKLPWCDRKKLLSRLTYSESVKDTYAIVVEDEESLKKAIKAFGRLPNCKGVIVKDYFSKHPKASDAQWFIFENKEGESKKTEVKIE